MFWFCNYVFLFLIMYVCYERKPLQGFEIAEPTSSQPRPHSKGTIMSNAFLFIYLFMKSFLYCLKSLQYKEHI